MAAGAHFYKRDPDAALSGMRELTLEQRGAYNTILDLIYARVGEVPDDERWMAGCLGCDIRVWRRLRRELIDLGKIFVKDGIIRNHRADLELRELFGKSVQARSAALARHLRRTSDGSSPELNDSQVPKSGPETRKNNGLADATAGDPHLRVRDRVRSENLIGQNGFEIFWQKYPKKVGKKAAQEAYAVAVTKVDEDTLIEGVRRYRSERFGQDDKFTKNPARWLDEECWNDPPPASKPNGHTAPKADEWALSEEDLMLARIFGGIATDTLLWRTGKLPRWDVNRLGPLPDAAGTKVPLEVLSRHGYADPAIYKTWKETRGL